MLSRLVLLAVVVASFGGQYIDERVATYDAAKAADDGHGAGGHRAAGWTYYLLNANYSVAERGNADGSQIERFNYASGGDWAGYDILPAVLRHDADEDGDVDLRDFANFQVCFDSTDPNDCLPYHDYDSGGNSDGVIDLADFEGLVHCFSAPDTAPPADCQTGRSRAAPPANDLFALHGRPVDILPDGKMLLYIRARYYDPKSGRWLQRDPTGYADGASLYESFRGNATRFADPRGTLIEELFNWWYSDKYASHAELMRANKYGIPYDRVRSSELMMFQNAGEAVIGLTAVGPAVGITVNPADVARESGREVAARHAAAVEATTQRLTAVSLAQLEAGASLEDATSTQLLTAVFVGDVIGVTPLLEAGYDVNLGSNTALSDEQVDFLVFEGNERFRRGLQGSGQFILIFAVGARGQSARPVVSAEAASIRARVLGNIAESQGARAASKFRVFAVREGQILALRAAQAETRLIASYFPNNRGFIGPTERQFLMPGQIIDRYGGSGYSRFFSPAGMPQAARALPPSSAGQPLRVFEVVKPFEVEAGTVAPAFGQLGLGQQFVAPVRLEILLKRGIIKEVMPTP